MQLLSYFAKKILDFLLKYFFFVTEILIVTQLKYWFDKHVPRCLRQVQLSYQQSCDGFDVFQVSAISLDI